MSDRPNPMRVHIVGAGPAGLAAALYFYPRVEPVVVDRMWPKVIEYKGGIEPSVRERTSEIKAWLGDVVKRSKEATKKKKSK